MSNVLNYGELNICVFACLVEGKQMELDTNWLGGVGELWGANEWD